MFAALREFFRAKNGNCACMEFSSGELSRDMGLPQGGNGRTNIEMQSANESKRLEGPAEGPQGGSNRHLSSTGSLVQLNDATDEFFDVPDESEYDQREAMWSSDESTHASVSSLNRTFFLEHTPKCVPFCIRRDIKMTASLQTAT